MINKLPEWSNYEININQIRRILKWCTERSVIISFAAIAVGTLFSLIHSHANDLPFRTLSIVQCVLITILCGALTISFVVLEHTMLDIVQDSLRHHRKSIILKRVLVIVIMLAFIVMATSIISYILNNFWTAVIICCIYYILGIIIVWNIKSSKTRVKTTTCWVLFWCLFVMILVPMNLGGFCSRKVEYCTYENDKTCQEYNYYGISEGLYQFVEDKDGEKHVILAPADSGYIRYEQEKSKLFGLIEL